jgi:hypothetical protein
MINSTIAQNHREELTSGKTLQQATTVAANTQNVLPNSDGFVDILRFTVVEKD